MGKPKITLYLDVVSPFAYIAYHITRNAAPFQACEITYVPVLLGGIMNACGNQPPISIKNKGEWIGKERMRWSKYFKVPISEDTPKPFPQSTVNTQRVLSAIQVQHPDKLASAFDALYQAFWVEGKTIGQPDVISAALEPAIGKDTTSKVLDMVKGDAAKKKLRDNSDQAFADGCFGLPYFVATNQNGETEAFWGVDHIGQLLDHLAVDWKRESSFKAVL